MAYIFMLPNEIIAELPVIITFKNGMPAIQVRKHFSDPDTMKKIISAAYHGVPIIILPSFTNKLQSLNSLIEKGIIYRDGEQYFFNI